MSAPSYVPTSPTTIDRAYESPPWRAGSWLADRPGDLGDEGQPAGELLGSPGPDQGYAFRLVRLFAGKVFTADRERNEDVIAGAVAVAIKRASLFGRAPVVHDLRVGFGVWGYLNEKPPIELVNVRRALFAEVANGHHYGLLRAVADAVPPSTLKLTPDKALEQHTQDWRSLLTLTDLPGTH